MRAGEMTPPVELIPAQRQRLWGWQAVANFTVGGIGAGLYGMAVLVAGFERTPAVALASWLAPLLVLAGFAAVAGEAGRPLRGPRVLWKVRTSWMSRELWIGGAFVLLIAADITFPLRIHRVQALAAAILLALCAIPSALLSNSLSLQWHVRVMSAIDFGGPPLPGLYFGLVLCICVAQFEGVNPVKLLVTQASWQAQG